MAELSQKRFAPLLAEAMDTLGVRGIDMAEWLGKDPTTVSRYRDPNYKRSGFVNSGITLTRQ